MKRIKAAIPFVVLLLGACGGGGSDSTAVSSTPAPSTEAGGSPPASGTTGTGTTGTGTTGTGTTGTGTTGSGTPAPSPPSRTPVSTPAPSAPAPSNPVPGPVPGPATGPQGGHAAKAIENVFTGTLAIRENGQLVGWGGSSCNLGLGLINAPSGPVVVGSDFTAFAPSDSQTHVFAIKTNGDLYAWGNSDEILGIGASGAVAPCIAPRKILSNVTRASAGIAVTLDGTIYRWGHRVYDPALAGTARDSARTVASPEPYTEIGTGWVDAASLVNTIALVRSDGALYSAGYQDSSDRGTLGVGTPGTLGSIQAPRVQQIGSAKNWTRVWKGDFGFFAANGDGELWGWGQNTQRELGDGTNVNRPAPVRVLGPGAPIIKVVRRGDVGFVLRADGALYAWGENGNKVFGDGTTTDAETPRQVQSATKDISVNRESEGYAVRANGDIWAWGLNVRSTNLLNCKACVSTGTGAARYFDPVLTDAFPQ